MVKNMYTPGGTVEIQTQTHWKMNTVEIQTQTHWKMNGCSTNASQNVLSPSSILPAPSSYSAFIPAKKNCAPLKILLF